MPSDQSLRSLLDELSLALYDCIGEGGSLGPTQDEYDRHRDKRYTSADYLLKAFGLPCKRTGWQLLLNAFGLLAPSNSHIQRAAWTRSNNGTTLHKQMTPPLFDEDDYPALAGYWTERVSYTKLDDGNTLKTTVRTFQIR